MNSKYVSRKADKDKVVHCPHCRGVILRDYKKDIVSGETSFRSRCPHCKKDVFIKIKNGIIVHKNGVITHKIE